MSDLNNLTIVIPTYNREHIIRKSIKYWESIGVHVLVLDGSDQRIFQDGLLNSDSMVTYFSFPRNTSDNIVGMFQNDFPDIDIEVLPPLTLNR